MQVLVNGCDLNKRQWNQVRNYYRDKDALWVERHDFTCRGIDGDVMHDYDPIENVDVAVLQKEEVRRGFDEDVRYGEL